MQHSVLWSIKPKWTYEICTDTKKIEVRKTRPNLAVPFKNYIYCTKDRKFPLSLGPFGPSKLDFGDSEYDMQGKIVAEFICPEVIEFTWDEYNCCYAISDDDLSLTCLTQEELYEYGKGKTLYGIRIENLITYDKPKPLWTMRHLCKEYGSENPYCDDCPYFIDDRSYEYDESDCGVSGLPPFIRPPQSWAYATPYKNDLKEYYPDAIKMDR